jgi:hypothetical protein
MNPIWMLNRTDKQIKKHRYNTNHLNKCKNIQADGSFKKYEFGKVYKITNGENDLIYIGSTYRPLSYRFSIHKYNYKKYTINDADTYISAFSVLCYEGCEIELIENVNCNSRKELQEREKYHIQQYGNRCVNKHYKEKTTKLEQLEEMIALAEDLIL